MNWARLVAITIGAGVVSCRSLTGSSQAIGFIDAIPTQKSGGGVKRVERLL